MTKYPLSIAASALIIYLGGCALIPGTPPPSTPTSPHPPSDYSPLPGDEKLTRDQVNLDVANCTLFVAESMPVQVNVTLEGNLSDPCHKLRVVASPPTSNMEINIDVYSVYDPNLACIMVIKPFSATIPLGSFAPGHFTVLVNGQLLGEFDA